MLGCHHDLAFRGSHLGNEHVAHQSRPGYRKAGAFVSRESREVEDKIPMGEIIQLGRVWLGYFDRHEN